MFVRAKYLYFQMPLDTLDDILEKYLPENELKEINRILYGYQRHLRFVPLKFEIKLLFFTKSIFNSDLFSKLESEQFGGYSVEKYRFQGVEEDDVYTPRIVKVIIKKKNKTKEAIKVLRYIFRWPPYNIQLLYQPTNQFMNKSRKYLTKSIK